MHYSLGADAPSWLIIDSATGQLSVNIDDTQNKTGPEAGSPDNHLVGNYTFTVYFDDGTAAGSGQGQSPTNSRVFNLAIVNDPTNINDTPNQVLNEDELLHIDGSSVTARDEYNLPVYTEDYYTLEIKLDNKGSWILIDDKDDPQTHYNAQNNTWNGNDITFTKETGDIQWTPNNGTCPIS